MKRVILIPLIGFICLIQPNPILGQVYYDEWPTVETNDVNQLKEEGLVPLWKPIGRTWDHRIITYFFQNGTTDIANSDERQAIRDGFEIWAAETDLAFLEVCSASQADIVIAWEVLSHGDPACYDIVAFDGAGGTFAHNMGGPDPNDCGVQGANIHFDDAETWTLNYRSPSAQPLDLVTVSAHETGHALGLFHTQVSGSLMLRGYSGSHRYLGSDDRAGIQSLYGLKNGSIISGPSSFCTSAIYSLPTLPAGVTVQWSASPSANVLLNPNGNQVEVTPTVGGTFTLIATLTSGCGNSTIISKSQIAAGSQIYGTYQAPGESGQLLTVHPVDPGYVNISVTCHGAAIFSWSGTGTVPYYPYFYPQYANCDFYLDEGESITLKVSATGTCGYTERNVAFYAPGPWFKIYPNPADNTLTIELKVHEITEATSQEITGTANIESLVSVKLFNNKHDLLRSAEIPMDEKIIFDIADLTNGTYYIHLSDGTKTEKKQVYVYH